MAMAAGKPLQKVRLNFLFQAQQKKKEGGVIYRRADSMKSYQESEGNNSEDVPPTNETEDAESNSHQDTQVPAERLRIKGSNKPNTIASTSKARRPVGGEDP